MTNQPTISIPTTTSVKPAGSVKPGAVKPAGAVKPSPDHLLTLVEPTTDGDATLDLAHDVVARGGKATVLMLITDRVERDIRSFADSEDLSYSMAEEHAIDRLASYCADRIGAEVPTGVERVGRRGVDIRRYLTDDVTTVAIPESLSDHRRLGRLVRLVDRPLVIVPDRPLVVVPDHAA